MNLLRIAAPLLFAAVLAQSATFAAEPATPPAQSAKPNIIFILVDDVSYMDFSCLGQKQFSTPNIDRLAAQGRIFANAYAGGVFCAPSRTALLTGLHASRAMPLATDAAGRGTKYRPTVAEQLKTVGYATCMVGKWHMVEGGDSWAGGVGKKEPATWEAINESTSWAQMPWNRGFDVCRVGYRGGLVPGGRPGCSNPYWPYRIETGDRKVIDLPENQKIDAAHLMLNPNTKAGFQKMFNAQGIYQDPTGKDASQLKFSEDIYRQTALEFMRANKDKPFYIHYATPLAHGPTSTKSLARYLDKPWPAAHKIWASLLSEIDDSVGLIVSEVKALGLEKNTIIILASDNGYAACAYLRNRFAEDDKLFKNKGPWYLAKGTLANGGLIVPFIAWGPGTVTPGTTARAVCFQDFMPTACELAGAPVPTPIDGTSFVRLLKGDEQNQPLHPPIVWTKYAGRRSIADVWASDAKNRFNGVPDALLLDDKWYALVFPNKAKPGTLTVRLFDILTDPGMKTDLSAAHPDLCARALTALKKYQSQSPQPEDESSRGAES